MAITVVDDDNLPGVIIAESDGGTSVIEGGTDSYTVVLDSRPTASMTIEVSAGDPGAATVSPAALSLTSTNWNSAQTVTVSGVDDNVDHSRNCRVSISHSATSTFRTSNPIVTSHVTVTVVDDDNMPGVTITELGGDTLPSGSPSADSYTVVLDNWPTASVSTEVKSGDPGAARVGPATLTFTTAHWNSAQTVTVSRVDDNVAQSGTCNITTSQRATSRDASYNGIAIPAVTTTVVDGHRVVIIESDGATSMTEGGSDSYTVVLASEPTANVRIRASSDTPGVALVNGREDAYL